MKDYLRSLFLWIFGFIAMEFFSLLAVLGSFFDDHQGNFANKCGIMWSKFMLWIAHIDVIVDGLDNLKNQESIIIVSNHQGTFDIFIMMACLPVNFRWVIKKELFKIPIFGTALQKARYISIDRENARMAMRDIKKAEGLLKEGLSIAVFPEGTRSKDGRLGNFKRGAFLLATRGKTPLVSVSIDGSYKIISKNGFVCRPQKVLMKIHKPIYVADLSSSERKELHNRVRAIIASDLEAERSVS